MSERAIGKILTGIDMPLAPSSGSLILCDDLYTQVTRFDTAFLGLEPKEPKWSPKLARLAALSVAKRPYGNNFEEYVADLAAAVPYEVERWSPQVIHAQHLGYGMSLAFVRGGYGLPIVSVAHGGDVLDAHASNQANEALNEVVAASEIVIAPSEALRSEMDSLTCGASKGKTRVVPWGIRADNISTVHEPHDRDQLNLLHAGRLDRNKGTAVIIEALARSAGNHHLTVIGEGSQEVELRELSSLLGVSGRVEFVPFMKRAELWGEFHKYDAFVLSSLRIEAFGLVLAEAQSHGLPILYSDIGSIGTIASNGGVPYPSGDADALARQIDRLSADHHLRARLSAAALENSTKFDIRHAARTIENISLEVLA